MFTGTSTKPSKAIKEAMVSHYLIMEHYRSKGFNPIVWPGVLNMNCLPFSLLAHRFVARTDRNAKVVIGRLLPIGVTLSSRSKNSIQTFHANNWLNTKPKFHAWICLGNGTIYDVVGPKLQNTKTGNVISDWDYLDTEKALESGFKYHEVIRERSKVTEFYRRLRLGQIFQWQAINLQTTSDELIEKKLHTSWIHTSPLK